MQLLSNSGSAPHCMAYRLKVKFLFHYSHNDKHIEDIDIEDYKCFSSRTMRKEIQRVELQRHLK
jgi:hypothetical protein